MELRGVKGVVIGISAAAAVICLIHIPSGWWSSKTFWVTLSTIFVFGGLLSRRRWLLREHKFALLSVLLAAHVAAWLALVSRFHPRPDPDPVFVLIFISEGIVLEWLLAPETAQGR